jgi:hypothetical protein
MKEYLFTSQTFAGYLKFVYDSEGVLVKFENNATLNDTQLFYLSKNFPFAESDLAVVLDKGKIQEVTDLTFERFWNEYGLKKDRIQAEDYWRKMPENEKAKAISGIKRYRFDCKANNRQMIYAVRYLRNKRYMDE